MREQANALLTFVNNNPSAKEKKVEVKIENWKVVLYQNNKKKRYFTISTMKADWTINHEENLARLNFIGKDWFYDFVKRYIPEIKSYAEIWKENIAKQKKQEKIAALNDIIKKHNNFILSKIEWYVHNLKLKEGMWIRIDNGKVQIVQNNNKVLGYFTLPLKDTTWKLINNEPKNMQLTYSEYMFKKWLEKHNALESKI
jgi:hypothetical protein